MHLNLHAFSRTSQRSAKSVAFHTSVTYQLIKTGMIGIAVTWKVVDTAKAVFNVDNYKAFLSLQCDSALRDIVRIYPYDAAPNVDTTGDGIADEGSLRGSSEIVAEKIRGEIQKRVAQAGIEVVEARITCRGQTVVEKRKLTMVPYIFVTFLFGVFRI